MSRLLWEARLMTPQILPNLLKVSVYSLTRPLKLLTLILGVVFCFLVPNFAVLIIALSLSGVGVMLLGDISNRQFVQAALAPLVQADPPLNLLLTNLITEVQTQIEVHRFQASNQKDLLAIRNSLLKIQKTTTLLDPQLPNVKFTKEYLPGVITKALGLINQKNNAKSYLLTEQKPKLVLEIKQLINQSEQLDDKFARDEYFRAVVLKQEQLAQINKLEQKLPRLDSQITKIIAVLEQSNTLLASTHLGSLETDSFDVSELLSESLKQVTTDI